ncbi:hypothetical protein [Mesorhizobium caraganae]|uniref:hypothetical protein n=1 Tax=Mesorhizobium caraganae TaxID=483206 RepID=UPI0017851D9E|nr:hypothetical protein [Mesorhizobium caraganae]
MRYAERLLTSGDGFLGYRFVLAGRAQIDQHVMRTAPAGFQLASGYCSAWPPDNAIQA